MNFTLEVDYQTCISCGKCVRVCPAGIFSVPSPAAKAQVHNRETCIFCGHCVAVCPTDSVKHSVFPPEKVHAIDRGQFPTPEQLMLLIKARRSNRAFSTRPVPQEYFDAILEAGHRAPTASNKQEVGFTLVTDPEKLRQIIRITSDVFAEKVKKVNYPVIKPVIKKFSPALFRIAMRLNALTQMVEEGKDPILRGATSVIFIHAPRQNNFGDADCNLAYQNASLMAESLGISQFYTGFVCRAIKEDKDKRINRLLGTEETIHAGLALGMPTFLYPNYIDKQDIRVNKV